MHRPKPRCGPLSNVCKALGTPRWVWLFALCMVHSTMAHAQEQILSYRLDDAPFADVREALAEAIAEEGVAQPVVSHFAAMLERTAEDLGHAQGLYPHAEILTFCSARVAATLAAEARENIALCPLSIAIYAPSEATDATVLAYRPLTLAGAGGDAARALMRRIVLRTAQLLGRD